MNRGLRARRLAITAVLSAGPLLGAWLARGCAPFGSADSTEDASRDATPSDAIDEFDAIDESRDEVGARDARAGACDANAPFGEPRLLLAPGATRRNGGWLVSKGLFFTQVSGGTYPQLFFAPFEADGAVGMPARFDTPEFSAVYFASLSDDGLTLFARATSLDGGILDLYRATRAGQSFTGVRAAFPGSLNRNETHPSLTSDALWFSRWSAANDFDIVRAPLLVDGGLGNASLVSSLNTPYDDAHPQVTADGLRVFFASNRDAGREDIWSATRMQPGDLFGAAAVVPELSSPQEEYPTWVSPDGCRIVLSSSRDGGTNLDLYVSERPR